MLGVHWALSVLLLWPERVIPIMPKSEPLGLSTVAVAVSQGSPTDLQGHVLKTGKARTRGEKMKNGEMLGKTQDTLSTLV